VKHKEEGVSQQERGSDPNRNRRTYAAYRLRGGKKDAYFENATEEKKREVQKEKGTSSAFKK